MSITIDVDLRAALGPARDQGARPTCLAFAATAAHEADHAGSDFLSTEYLFFGAVRRSHGDRTRGLGKRAVSEALLLDGQPPEPTWPYQPTVPSAKEWKPPATCKPLHRAKLEFAPRSVSDVRALVEAKKPVVLVMQVSHAMYRPAAGAIVKTRPRDKVIPGKHAIVAVGSGYAADGKYLLVRNSWGATWGDAGHAWLHDDYLAPRLSAAGVLSREPEETGPDE